MNTPVTTQGGGNGYLFGRGSAWFAYTMTVALMIIDYVDRQVIVSMFPYLKAEWHLSDKELGLLVSIISITVAVFGIPVAWIADRVSRVKSVVVMALIWSLACISCMFAQNYGQLLAARAVVGLGEAGYGSVGAAMVATHFPQKMRAGLLGGFFACASIGSVLGVILGGVIAARWVCVGAAAQLIALSALWSWLPSFLNRTYGVAPDKAGVQAALVVLAGAVGGVVLGAIVDWAGTRRSIGKFVAIAVFSLATMVALMLAFGVGRFGIALSPNGQFALILLGGFLATCTVGPAAAIVIDVIHPGVRSTGASVLSLFQNLFGLAAGPYIAGALSDAVGLEMALTLTPLACVVAAASFLAAGRVYDRERQGSGADQITSATVEHQPAFARA